MAASEFTPIALQRQPTAVIMFYTGEGPTRYEWEGEPDWPVLVAHELEQDTCWQGLLDGMPWPLVKVADMPDWGVYKRSEDKVSA